MDVARGPGVADAVEANLPSELVMLGKVAI
jgi:hypothetical protein